jgi:hypothetical protein
MTKVVARQALAIGGKRVIVRNLPQARHLNLLLHFAIVILTWCLAVHPAIGLKVVFVKMPPGQVAIIIMTKVVARQALAIGGIRVIVRNLPQVLLLPLGLCCSKKCGKNVAIRRILNLEESS